MSSRKPELETLSPFEWLIMNTVWDAERVSAREVMDRLPPESQRAYTTIQTYLERLVEKGYLTKEKIGLVNFYQALIAREGVVEGETERFINRVYQGSAPSLAAFLLKRDRLSAAELEQIKALVGQGEDHD